MHQLILPLMICIDIISRYIPIPPVARRDPSGWTCKEKMHVGFFLSLSSLSDEICATQSGTTSDILTDASLSDEGSPPGDLVTYRANDAIEK